MKTLIILVVLVFTTRADAKYGDEMCDTAGLMGEKQCCVYDEGKYSCMKLQDKGDRCLFNNSGKVIDDDSYAFYCPCKSELLCLRDKDSYKAHCREE